MKNNIALLYPDAIFLCSQSNEEHHFNSSSCGSIGSFDRTTLRAISRKWASVWLRRREELKPNLDSDRLFLLQFASFAFCCGNECQLLHMEKPLDSELLQPWLCVQVGNFICDWCPGSALGRLSFIAHSIGPSPAKLGQLGVLCRLRRVLHACLEVDWSCAPPSPTCRCGEEADIVCSPDSWKLQGFLLLNDWVADPWNRQMVVMPLPPCLPTLSRFMISILGCSWLPLPPCVPNLSPFMISLPEEPMVSEHLRIRNKKLLLYEYSNNALCFFGHAIWGLCQCNFICGMPVLVRTAGKVLRPEIMDSSNQRPREALSLPQSDK